MADSPAPAPHPEEHRPEEEVRSAHDEIRQEGAERLHRSWRALIATGLLGGSEIALGVLAYLATLHETGSHLLAGLAFSVGLVAILLAHSELFTEGFLYPVTAVLTGDGSVLDLLRLWGVTLVTNLVGGWLVMWLVVTGFPDLHPTLVDSAHHFLEVPLSARGAALALLGGLVITLMTRMHAGADSDGTRVMASVACAFLLAGLSLFHSVLDSIIIFGAMHAGDPQSTWGAWLGWFWWVALLNVIGGVVGVTLPRAARGSEVSPGETA